MKGYPNLNAHNFLHYPLGCSLLWTESAYAANRPANYFSLSVIEFRTNKYGIRESDVILGTDLNLKSRYPNDSLRVFHAMPRYEQISSTLSRNTFSIFRSKRNYYVLYFCADMQTSTSGTNFDGNLQHLEEMAWHSELEKWLYYAMLQAGTNAGIPLVAGVE